MPLAHSPYEQVPLRDRRVEAGLVAHHAHVVREVVAGQVLLLGGVDHDADVDEVVDDAVPREGAALALEGYVVVALGHAGHSDQLGLVALVAVLLAVNLAVKFEG